MYQRAADNTTGRGSAKEPPMTVRKRTAQAAIEASHELTAQEAQVAQLAREGLSNPEIGARLFLSPRAAVGAPEELSA
jgi:DNA-binding NarL/FixJ family response regulator